jgi:uncharacterized protein YaiI (UPF0178 family)
LLHIYVDADACPVKPEIYRVAKRYQLDVILVANSWMRIPADQRIKLVVVTDGLDAADDWIAENIDTNDIEITADIPLASDVIDKGGYALNPRGELYTRDNIRQRLTMRNFMQELRSSGVDTGGPSSFNHSDRQAFANALDRFLTSIRKNR